MNLVKFKNVLIYLSIIVCFSCNASNVFEGKHIFIEQFPLIIFPEAEKIDIDIPGIVDFAIVDTVLLALIIPDPEILLQAYSLNNYNLIGTLIKKGQGPNEFLQASIPIQFNEDSTGCNAWMLDFSLNSFYLLKITNTIEQQRTVVEKKYNLKKLGFALNFVYVNDTLIWGTNWTLDNLELFAYNTQKELVINQTKLFKTIRYTSSNLISAFSHGVAVKPDLTKIVINMLYFNQLHIISLNNIDDRFSFSTSKNPGNFEQIIKLIKSDRHDELIAYYRDIRTTNNLIFACNNTYQLKDVDNASKTIIHVFDWDGNPIALIELPHYASYFAIDEKRGFLYGLSDDEFYEKEILYKYDIKSLTP